MNGTEIPRRIRILHIVGGMNRGGVETWLMHVLRHIDRGRFQMDFLVHTAEPCAYDDEIRALGSRILPCLHYQQPWSYARNFRRLVAEFGPYDVVHSHVHRFSGFTLRLARHAGIPARIAHSHYSVSSQNISANPLRWLYLSASQRWVERFATVGLAVSERAAEALFGCSWRRRLSRRLLYCGIDLTPFDADVDRSVRAELQLPSDAFVIGHVGRFVEEKNHCFLLEIVRSVANVDPQTRLLLVGDGPLRPAIERRVAELGLAEHVVFAGCRTDVPRLLLGAMDVFLMPSVCEGLPLAALEAQAAGLTCILSEAVTRELDVLPEMIRRLPLSIPASVWADHVLAVGRSPAAVSRVQALKTFKHSPFDIVNSVANLQRIYYGNGAARWAHAPCARATKKPV